MVARQFEPITYDELFRAFTPYGVVIEISVKDSTLDPVSLLSLTPFNNLKSDKFV